MELCGKNDGREMTSPQILRMFQRGRYHTIYVKCGPETFKEFLSVTVHFIRNTSSMIRTKKGIIVREEKKKCTVLMNEMPRFFIIRKYDWFSSQRTSQIQIRSKSF